MKGFPRIHLADNSKLTQLSFLLDNENLKKDLSVLKDKWSKKKPKKIGEWAQIRNDIKNLRKKYHLSVMFSHILQQIFLEGKITNFQRVRYLAIPREVLEKINEEQEEILEVGNYEDAFLILPEASMDEISKHISRFRKNVKNLVGSPSSHHYKLHTPRSDTMTNIPRDRKWYELHKNKHLSYGEILKMEGKGITRDGIIKAIKAYGEKLRTV